MVTSQIDTCIIDPCKIIVEISWSKMVNTFIYKRNNMHNNDIIEF